MSLRRDPHEIKMQILKESATLVDWLFVGVGVVIAFGAGSGSEWFSSND